MPQTAQNMAHDWDELYFCTRCGASKIAVVNGDREKQCDPPGNLIPVSSRIASKRLESLGWAHFAGFVA